MSREQKIAELYERLRTRRDLVRRFLAGEISQIGSDDDEESLDDEAYVSVAESEGRELDRLNAALERIRSGRYGRCEACEGEIPLLRLQAVPCASLCITCQHMYETQGQQFHLI